MNKEKAVDYFLVFFGVLFCLLPLVYITTFTFPFADDWCRTNFEPGKFIQKAISFYNNLSGRYINGLFSYLPVYEPRIYRGVLSFSIIVLLLSLYYFIRKLFSAYHLSLPRHSRIMIGVLILAAIVAFLPSLFEFFYWYAAMSVYLWGFIFFLFYLVELINIDISHKINFWRTGLIIVILTGNNELYIGIVNILLLVLILRNFIRTNRLSKPLSFLFLLSVLSSMVVVLSPGSSNRQDLFPEGGELFYSIYSSLLSSGMFVLKSLIEFPYFLLGLGILFMIVPFGSSKYKVYNPFLLAVLSFTALTSVFFIIYYAVGFVKSYEGRIGNTIHLVYFTFWLINLVNFGVWVRKLNICKNARHFNMVSRISIFIFLICLTWNENYASINQDILKGDLRNFDASMKNRMSELKTQNNDTIRLSKIPGTRVLEYEDVSSNPKTWENRCYRYMVNEGKDHAPVIIFDNP